MLASWTLICLYFLWFDFLFLFLRGHFYQKSVKNIKIICLLSWQLSVWLTIQANMSEPTFVADPKHCVKTFAGHIFKLAKMPLKKSPVCVSYAKQMKLYWGCFIKPNNCKSLAEMSNAFKAPPQHLWNNNHNYCNSEWCGRKNIWKRKGI